MNEKEHWERVYAQTSPLEVSWYQERPRTSLEMIGQLPLKKSDPLIDVGGGASTLVDGLLEQGFEQLRVLDLSGNALAYAQERLGRKATAVAWEEADIREVVPDQVYALWHDRAVFHFLKEAQDREAYKRALAASLRIGGYVIIGAFTFGGSRRCSGLDVVQYDAAKLSAPLGPNFRLVEERVETHQTPAGRQQPFGFYAFVKVR